MVTISTSSFLQPFFGFSRGFSSWLIQPAAENGMVWPGGGERFKAKTKPLQPQKAFITIKNCWSTSTLAKVRLRDAHKEKEGLIFSLFSFS